VFVGFHDCGGPELTGVPGTCGKKSKIAGLDLPKSAVCKFFGFAFKTNFKSDYFSLLLLLLPSSEQPLSLP
jgi:hypothetical protein